MNTNGSLKPAQAGSRTTHVCASACVMVTVQVAVWSPLLQLAFESPFRPYFTHFRKVLWFCHHIYAGSLLRRLLFFIKKGCDTEMFRGEEALCLQLSLSVQKNIIVCLY